MSWVDEALPVLRVVIGDDETPYTYCDTRLSDLLVAVAKLMVMELSFDTSYTVTVSTSTIDPDPSEDQFFIPLLVLKAATKIANSEYKAASMNAGSVSDGPSTINLGESATSLKERMKMIQEDYDNAKMQYMVGNAIGCQSVLSTCVSIYGKCYENGYFCYRDDRDCPC